MIRSGSSPVAEPLPFRDGTIARFVLLALFTLRFSTA